MQEKPLGPGKYAFNTYAGNIVLVPTTNFVLHWVTGRTESHRYDESLRSIDLVTKDAYEPTLPLSVVVHIDYQKAPSVIQRFGDVKKLITQTLDPMLSAYFRDVAHKRTMLELLQERDSIQHESSSELGRKFHNFDIECVDVLIGKPDTQQSGGKIETLLEQLRLRQLSLEQVETYSKQVTAAQNLRVLNEAQRRRRCRPNCRTRWCRSGSPKTRPRPNWCGLASRPSRWSSRPRPRVKSVPWPAAAKARGSCRKASPRPRSCCARSARSPTRRLYALTMAAQNLAKCTQPLVPERVFITGGGGGGAAGDGQSATGAMAGNGVLGLLLNLLVAEKSGFQLVDHPGGSDLNEFTEKVARQAMEAIQQAVTSNAGLSTHHGNGAGPPPVPRATAATLASTIVEGTPNRSDGA